MSDEKSFQYVKIMLPLFHAVGKLEIWGEMDWTYQIISHQGVNYKLRSKAGKDLVVHNNQVKACTIPVNKGEPYCPVWEAEEIEIVSMPREEMPEVQNVPLNRPPRLRQNINPPLRFGDFVTH